jgi:hypothetical protein
MNKFDPGFQSDAYGKMDDRMLEESAASSGTCRSVGSAPDHKIGPFLCEWCGKPMRTAKGRRANGDGTVAIIGECRGGCGVVWSKPVHVPNV